MPFYRQIQDQMSDLVRSGQLAPGAKLPSVRELAAALVVSVITTRRAYSELESAGLIVRKRGKGTFVTTMPLQEQPSDAGNEILQDAVQRARRLGMDKEEILTFVARILDESKS